MPSHCHNPCFCGIDPELEYGLRAVDPLAVHDTSFLILNILEQSCGVILGGPQGM